jgi:PilZ domain
MSTPQTVTQRERRIDRRVTVNLQMFIKGTDGAGKNFQEAAQSVNVSRRGAAFLLDRPVEKGANLEIRIPMPRGGTAKEPEEFNAICRVVHVREVSGALGRLVGVEFTGRSFQRIFVSESGEEQAT